MSKQDFFKGVPIVWDGSPEDESINQTLHEWWGIETVPVDDETRAKIKKGLDEAWRACK